LRAASCEKVAFHTPTARGIPDFADSFRNDSISWVISLGDFAGGAIYFVEEGAEFDGIFFAGAGFDAAGHIDGKWADDTDGFGNVFGSEAARENDAVRLGSATSEVPVAGGAAAAVLAGERRVEKERGGGAKAGKIRCGSPLPQAQNFDNGETAGDSVNNLCGFVAVELSGSEAQCFAESGHRSGGPIHEDADRSDEGRETTD
jgi:hypothetical protein